MTNLLFFHQNLIEERFLQTDLGQLYLSIPFDKLALTISSPKSSLSGKGCKPWFDVKGGIALQFLKHYLVVPQKVFNINPALSLLTYWV